MDEEEDSMASARECDLTCDVAEPSENNKQGNHTEPSPTIYFHVLMWEVRAVSSLPNILSSLLSPLSSAYHFVLCFHLDKLWVIAMRNMTAGRVAETSSKRNVVIMNRGAIDQTNVITMMTVVEINVPIMAMVDEVVVTMDVIDTVEVAQLICHHLSGPEKILMTVQWDLEDICARSIEI